MQNDTNGLHTDVGKLSVRRHYRCADKPLARPDWKKKQLKCRHFSSDAETCLDGQPSELFLNGLQKSEFGGYSLFPSWSG